MDCDKARCNELCWKWAGVRTRGTSCGGHTPRLRNDKGAEDGVPLVEGEGSIAVETGQAHRTFATTQGTKRPDLCPQLRAARRQEEGEGSASRPSLGKPEGGGA